MVTIVDYGVGNLGSIANMLKRIGEPSTISSDPIVIAKADRIILPGVGHFDHAMEQLEKLQLREVLDQKALDEGVPILGICLGMQLLTRESGEGVQPGLGWVPADTRQFEPDTELRLKVPHMGWNVVECSSPSRLTEGVTSDTRFYFVHSYYVRVDHEQNSILKSWHGVHFDAAIQHKNILGVQFHPEKSHRFGMKLLGNFSKI